LKRSWISRARDTKQASRCEKDVGEMHDWWPVYDVDTNH
jgi:hypothetical protein